MEKYSDLKKETKIPLATIGPSLGYANLSNNINKSN